MQICIPADWHKLKKLPYEVSKSKRLKVILQFVTSNTQTLPTGVLLIVSSIQLSSNNVNSSQSTPAHSLCQTLGQCRRAKKATEQCNSEGAKNGGKRSGKIDTYPSLPSCRVFAQLFSIRFPYYLEAWNRLSNAQHSDRSTSKNSHFSLISSALPLFAFSMLSIAVFSLRPRGLSTSKKANQNK